MTQADLNKHINGFKKCLVLRGQELILAKEQQDVTFPLKVMIHIAQHAYYKSLVNYQVDSGELTDRELNEMIARMKITCPGMKLDQGLVNFTGRLPIKIGRWNVGDNSYVS